MNLLKPFKSEKVNFLLKGDAHLVGEFLHFEFVLKDPEGLFLLPSKNERWTAPKISQVDGLWNHTCFEAFLNPIESSLYFEFNFSLKPAWNVYEFDKYREPQPPKRSDDFQMINMSWNFDEKKLNVEFLNKSKFKKFNVGLTAVLEEKNGNKHYCALTHAGDKADFHLLQSFTLKRGF